MLLQNITVQLLPICSVFLPVTIPLTTLQYSCSTCSGHVDSVKPLEFLLRFVQSRHSHRDSPRAWRNVKGGSCVP
ncbi:hypothetical protein EJ03DRAFT_193866 [Teratosphaeria nubilosa]|uniref:Secreted protein n=1 Tax=Teratosphaeria nubilosa TaxID=161662 RepID=A0A6G1KZ62_9PEZI|nr:hypothetical protein EJ03DRAFT_193866 [Teratosphaeria nubilosa]